MPKNNIDYSNTIIYKIYCNDNDVKDVYIGHTTNFSQRKCCHKNTCNNIQSELYNLKIYKFIRDHGGWNNWNMVEIAKYNCKDSTEARIKEQYHHKLETSILNSLDPKPEEKKYTCNVCNISCCDKIKLDIHNKTSKHLKKLENIIAAQNETLFHQKNAIKYECFKCDFKCSKNSDWQRHILTQKHQNETDDTTTILKKSDKISHYNCSCGQVLKSRSTIWRHKKKCCINNAKDKEDPDLSDKEIIKLLIKENSDFKNMILDVVKSIQPNNITNNNNNTTNNNNTFNLQFYLNDTCKDAVNLVDFVQSLQVQLNDLEETARLGYSEGVSRIILNGLNELDVCKRPIHCSDLKRETLYIKDQDEWSKEDADRSHLTKAIKTVSKKNIDQIFEWQKKYPEYNDPDSKQSDRYMEMICNTMNGSSKEEQDKNMNKIIKNITKEVVIDKTI